MSSGQFYGKYRGMVINNVDPMQMGRLQVQVPDVTGLAPASWAMPCVPVAGIQNGLFVVPMIGSGVWVEFEKGDINYPVWVGCFWGSASEVPAMARLTPPLTDPRRFGSRSGSASVGACDVLLRDFRQGMHHRVCDSVL